MKSFAKILVAGAVAASVSLSAMAGSQELLSATLRNQLQTLVGS